MKGRYPIDAASIAASRGQVIYSLIFGHNGDKNGDMEAAAKITGGECFHVEDKGMLREILSSSFAVSSIHCHHTLSQRKAASFR